MCLDRLGISVNSWVWKRVSVIVGPSTGNADRREVGLRRFRVRRLHAQSAATADIRQPIRVGQCRRRLVLRMAQNVFVKQLKFLGKSKPWSHSTRPAPAQCISCKLMFKCRTFTLLLFSLVVMTLCSLLRNPPSRCLEAADRIRFKRKILPSCSGVFNQPFSITLVVSFILITSGCVLSCFHIISRANSVVVTVHILGHSCCIAIATTAITHVHR